MHVSGVQILIGGGDLSLDILSKSPWLSQPPDQRGMVQATGRISDDLARHWQVRRTTYKWVLASLFAT